MCTVLSSSATEITCRTPVVPPHYYDKWSEVVVTQRIVDEAVNLNADLARIFFYKQGAPVLTAANQEITPVLAGQRVILLGQNLETAFSPSVNRFLYHFFNKLTKKDWIEKLKKCQNKIIFF